MAVSKTTERVVEDTNTGIAGRQTAQAPGPGQAPADMDEKNTPFTGSESGVAGEVVNENPKPTKEQAQERENAAANDNPRVDPASRPREAITPVKGK